MKLPGWLARRLRKVAGPDPELLSKLLMAQAEVTRVNERRLVMSRKADERQIEIDRLRAKLVRLMNVEPGPADGCTKVRLRDETEAWEFAGRLSDDTGRGIENFRVYPCDICPRQPVGIRKFLHVTSDQTQEQRSAAQKKNAGRRKASGRAIGDRIDPDVLVRLKEI